MGGIIPIGGHENYGIDASGAVYKMKDGTWTVKKPIYGKNGYLSVALWRNNQERRVYVHHLVLEAFVGARPEGYEALHADGTRTNNRLSNLRWGTRKENVADMFAHGTGQIGSKSKSAKLSFADVLWVRDMWMMGFSVREIMAHFKVSQGTIRRVINHQTYKKEVVHVV